jgi:hypothetical protein
MRMGIGLGVGINRSNYAQGIFGAYATRVVADGGVVEGGACVDAVSSLLQSASLLLVPSGYKGGKLYAEIPTNGNGDLTWTRGSDAFRTNASGLIQRVPWNLLSYSEEFSNAYWNKITSTISANTTTAPNGTLTADTLSVTTSTYSGLGRAITGVSANYNVSIYAKKNTKNWLYLIDVLGTGARAWFDLDNGVLGTVASGYTATITNVGDGWYRCALSNNTAQALAYYQLGLADANNGITPTSSGSAFIWGAQLVEGTTAQTYLPTTDRLNFPRLSYMYGSCPSVLLEPQRTNLALYSAQFDDATWAKSAVSVTANTTTSPDGTSNADAIIPNTSNTVHYNQQTIVTGLANNSFSIYAKNAGYNFIGLAINNSGALGVIFNLTTGAITATGASITNYTSQSVGNGWWRFSITANVSIGSIQNYVLQNGTLFSGFAGNGTDGIYLWGAQLEAGAYPTTYISTTSATATRVADSAVKTGISSLIGQTEGVIFLDFIFKTSDSTVGGQIGISDTSKNNRVVLWNNSTNNTLALQLKASGTNAINNVSVGTFVDGTRYKIAIAYKSGDTAVYVNGTQTITNSASFTFASSLSDFILGSYETTLNNGHQFCFKTALFQTRLLNSELATLTTL